VDLAYRSTGAYASLIKAAECGKPMWRQQILLDRRELIDLYFERFSALFRSIREHGVLSYNRLRERERAEPGERNVGVAIGCDGQLYRLPGGQHRTAIAKVLGLPSMPVEVRLIHTKWLSGVMSKSSHRPTDAVREGIDLTFRSPARPGGAGASTKKATGGVQGGMKDDVGKGPDQIFDHRQAERCRR
jgi:hypothetical protein